MYSKRRKLASRHVHTYSETRLQDDAGRSINAGVQYVLLASVDLKHCIQLGSWPTQPICARCLSGLSSTSVAVRLRSGYGSQIGADLTNANR